MPSNPQVPREVAEAKGKGAVRLAVLGISLAAIGLAAVLVGVSGASSSSGSVERAQAVTPAQMLPAGVESQAGNYPLCADATDVFFDPDHCVRLVKVKMHPQCWSGWISTPLDWGWEGNSHPGGVDMLFLDGTHVYLADKTHPRFDNKRGVFRVRGEGEFTVKIVNGPLEREQARNNEEAVRTGRPPQPVYRNGGDALGGRPYKDPCGDDIRVATPTSEESSEPKSGKLKTYQFVSWIESEQMIRVKTPQGGEIGIPCAEDTSVVGNGGPPIGVSDLKPGDRIRTDMPVNGRIHQIFFISSYSQEASQSREEQSPPEEPHGVVLYWDDDPRELVLKTDDGEKRVRMPAYTPVFQRGKMVGIAEWLKPNERVKVHYDHPRGLVRSVEMTE